MGRKMAVFILSGFPCLFPVFDFPFQMQSSVLMKIKDNMSVCTDSRCRYRTSQSVSMCLWLSSVPRLQQAACTLTEMKVDAQWK